MTSDLRQRHKAPKMDLNDYKTAQFHKSTLYKSLSNVQGRSQTSSPAKSAQEAESALFDIVQEISSEYLLQQLAAQTNRSLSANQIREKLQSRAIGLKSRQARHGRVRAPKKEEAHRPSKRQKASTSVQWKNDSKVLRRQCVFLKQLNILWNDYMFEMMEKTGDVRPSIVKLNKIEWVGALVRLQVITSHSSYQDKVALVLEERPSTWRLAIVGDGRLNLWSAERMNADTSTDALQSYKEIIVDKKRTQLVALVRTKADPQGAYSSEDRIFRLTIA